MPLRWAAMAANGVSARGRAAPPPPLLPDATTAAGPNLGAARAPGPSRGGGALRD